MSTTGTPLDMLLLGSLRITEHSHPDGSVSRIVEPVGSPVILERQEDGSWTAFIDGQSVATHVTFDDLEATVIVED